MSVFVLGPSTTHLEPLPSVSPPPTPGRRGIKFHPTVPTQPGGRANVILDVKDDSLKDPISIYAFFVQPVSSVPTGDDLNPDWFFKCGSPSGSAHISTADASGGMQITAPGVKPSLQPHHCQTILEYDS